LFYLPLQKLPERKSGKQDLSAEDFARKGTDTAGGLSSAEEFAEAGGER
jgi:hypothetical protein